MGVLENRCLKWLLNLVKSIIRHWTLFIYWKVITNINIYKRNKTSLFTTLQFQRSTVLHNINCYRGRASLKAHLHCSIAWLNPHDQNWISKPCFYVINRRAFRFNWSIKTLLSFDSIVAARLNPVCKHPHSQLCGLFVCLVVFLDMNKDQVHCKE
jgi:hypothetical protein